MEIRKKRIAHLEKVYAVTAVRVDGREFCMAASENRGGTCLLIDPESEECFTVWNGPGGVMSLVPLKEEQAVLSIEGFYPVYDSKEAAVCKTVLAFRDGKLTTDKTELCRLPYVHRIGIVNGDGKTFLIASTLCNDKAYVEDWNHPGAVYVGEYVKGCPVSLTCLYEGLTKNHGMYIKEDNSCAHIFVGAAEGILHLCKAGAWSARLWKAGETSDVWLEDVDGDGNDEIAAIQGFHGDRIRFLRRQGERYCCIGELPVQFGHVLWAGELFGELYIIGGSRAGDKALSFYRVERKKKPVFVPVYCDFGTGAAQIAVVRGKRSARIFAASHGEDAVDMYTLSGN
ncbi:hypothetical protein [[Clostridium] hylemonae]|uniref:FG-GAP repeat protein n=1 Tax=[Clostridium] hylemonae DSM 15053 TaxID=553973 RepID=C0BYZ1_9FIRM|nr:hypothetical protein [[Clostridium] hylemonae]EEG75069.1 hypothetical protein CLOHYLEM_05030 [[Clostridium] hylemonae DSM 15053]QEK18412.1 hypothetical protein LAJLEIBI_02429 [[Clostridium] hylemonae DSM 15053]